MTNITKNLLKELSANIPFMKGVEKLIAESILANPHSFINYSLVKASEDIGVSQGSIINFASGAGLFGNYGQASYAAAKEAIRGLSRVAATEWAKDGINTNVVCPLAWTAQLEGFERAYPDAFKANVKMPPAGHFGDAETEIGRVCVQLASPDFKYMNGETLTLEGGMGLRP